MGVAQQIIDILPQPVLRKSSAKARVFISYRRDDSAGFSLAIEKALSQALGRGKVFIDIDDISPGDDFEDHIHQSIFSCDVLVVVIGQNWNPSTSIGARRLDDSGDWVRREIAIALKRNITVIPVLVEGASMPDTGQLPKELEALARCNGFVMDRLQFAMQAEYLVKSVREVLKRSIWNRIKQWFAKRKVAVAVIITLVIVCSFIYRDEVRRVWYEGTANSLHYLGLREAKFIEDQIDRFKVRDLTIGLYDNALQYVDDDIHEARILMKQGLEYGMHQFNHADTALEHLESARGLLDVFIEKNDDNANARLVRAEVLRYMGVSAVIEKDWKKATALYQAAVEDYKKAYRNVQDASPESRKDIAELNSSLAFVFRKQENFSSAKKYYLKSLAIYKELDPSSEGLDVAQGLAEMLESQCEIRDRVTG